MKENIKFRGTWCSSCACSSYEAGATLGHCQNCNHEGSSHSAPDIRSVTLYDNARYFEEGSVLL